MKTTFVAATLALAALFTTSCEQHKWSETSKLFKAHGGEKGEHGAHGDAKGHGDDHGKADSHGEKKEGEAKH
ncbi:hypothetical protein [Verrucomicrobium spinosum]|uniref:hypothetical protein n=1 Tax=Verrucomicrobium spinosum TaxID=2736 RepID=UPI0001745B0D|nr:hypothetical protein [Verrucomicrobium spinosum]